MKTQFVIYPAMIALLVLSCGEAKDSVNEESIEAQNEISGPLHENDTTIVKRDGTLLDGTLDQANTVQLPAEVLKVIENDRALSTDKIKSTRKFTEDGITYYEINFTMSDQSTKTLTYDETGKVKSKDQ